MAQGAVKEAADEKVEKLDSVVSVNEGGTGLGYSKLTVRGTKGSQINVTLNGITLNDAESQEVFWVNIPALSLGSYGTFSSVFSASSGLIKHGLYLNAAYSRSMTDGYIRNAFAEVQSAMAVLGWLNEKNSLQVRCPNVQLLFLTYILSRFLRKKRDIFSG